MYFASYLFFMRVLMSLMDLDGLFYRPTLLFFRNVLAVLRLCAAIIFKNPCTWKV